MNPVAVSKTQEARIRGLLNVRDSARNLIALQLEGASDEAVHKEQANLNSLYDDYQADGKDKEKPVGEIGKTQ